MSKGKELSEAVSRLKGVTDAPIILDYMIFDFSLEFSEEEVKI